MDDFGTSRSHLVDSLGDLTWRIYLEDEFSGSQVKVSHGGFTWRMNLADLTWRTHLESSLGG